MAKAKARRARRRALIGGLAGAVAAGVIGAARLAANDSTTTVKRTFGAFDLVRACQLQFPGSTPFDTGAPGKLQCLELDNTPRVLTSNLMDQQCVQDNPGNPKAKARFTTENGVKGWRCVEVG